MNGKTARARRLARYITNREGPGPAEAAAFRLARVLSDADQSQLGRLARIHPRALARAISWALPGERFVAVRDGRDLVWC